MKEKVALKTSPADAGYSRLHITPFDSELLKVIVPAAVLPNTRRISYHSIQTFPDKRYGFVELPTADAVKIKNKLNGATLKGAKIHIEPARPEIMPSPIPDAIVDPNSTIKSKKSKSDKKDKKRKRDNLEIVGVELEDGRKVKRGWTVTPEEAQAKKKKAKDEEKKRAKSEKKDDKKKKRKRQEPESQYSDKPEALVKTRLPPNKVDDSTGRDKKKSKKSKHREVLVHEFENNTKFASFLKTTQPTPATGREGASFVEGKGWVLEDGTVTEEVKSTRPTTVPRLQVASMQASRSRTAEADDDTSSSSGSSSEADDSPSRRDTTILESIPSFSGSTGSQPVIESDPAGRPKSSASMRSLTIQIPATPTPAAAKVHPLEALYKRQQPNNADAAVTQLAPAETELFTFGSGLGDDIEDDEDQAAQATFKDDSSFQGSQLPMTPFSKQDFEWRNTRSAAPTPDTAHPSRISRIWPLGGDEDALEDVQEDSEEDDAEEMADDSARAGMDEDGEEIIDKHQDFQKWFWKNRGQLDRAWRERRRVARKEKRHRDNKAKEDRAI
ncbi:hypothetical protein N0V93_002456 [Gnomoniopsis smithogilvyi]|uniref:RRM domain-containing protein n=1 Tax=Gnomoniopsis smithogilvyi TaxID=1191159 RepID=A0A9W8YWP2_9PEZI|nr:hypothetical protein N0V93_002456 [Gnomoniopsis smithogilvyi]